MEEEGGTRLDETKGRRAFLFSDPSLRDARAPALHSGPVSRDGGSKGEAQERRKKVLLRFAPRVHTAAAFQGAEKDCLLRNGAAFQPNSLSLSHCKLEGMKFFLAPTFRLCGVLSVSTWFQICPGKSKNINRRLIWSSGLAVARLRPKDS